MSRRTWVQALAVVTLVSAGGCNKESSDDSAAKDKAAEEKARREAEEEEIEEQKKAVVSAESEAKHAKALALLDAMDQDDPWVDGFKRSVKIMEMFDVHGIAFVTYFAKSQSRTGGGMGDYRTNPYGARARLERQIAEQRKWKAKLVVAVALLGTAIEASPDNELPKNLKASIGEPYSMIDAYAALGLHYQRAGLVDIKSLRDILEKAAKRFGGPKAK